MRTQRNGVPCLARAVVIALALGALPVVALGQVTYVASGTGCGVTATSCSPGIPAGNAQNDILVAVMHSRTNTAHTCTTNCTGWTEFSTQAGDATGGRLSVWWLRRGASAPAAPTFAGPATESYAGRIFAFRGVTTAGNPYNVVGTNTTQAASTTFTGTNLTTTVANAMVVFAGGAMDNNTWGPAGGTTGGGMLPSTADANFYMANAAGTQNSVFLGYDGTPNGAAGAQGAPTETQATVGPDAGRWFTFALAPASIAVTTVGIGTDPLASSICFNGASTYMDDFTLGATVTADTVTALTVTLNGSQGATTWQSVQTVTIANSAGTPVANGTATPASNTVSVAGPLSLSAPIGSTPSYRVYVTPNPAGPAGNPTVTGTVTAITSTNATKTYSDSTSATVTLDNSAPADVATFTATPTGSTVNLSWTPSGSVLILRHAASVVTAVPTKGQAYTTASPAFGDGSVVVYAGSGTSASDLGVPNGTYYYKAFALDGCNIYAAGVNSAVVTVFLSVPATTTGALTATAASCTQVQASAAYTGDTDANNTVSFSRGPSSTGPWTAVSTCQTLGGGSNPRVCSDTGVTIGQSYWYQALFADAGGVTGTNPVTTSSGTLVPACAGALA